MNVNLKNNSNSSITLLDLLKLNHFSKDLIKKLKINYDVYTMVAPHETILITLPYETSTVVPSEGKINIVYEDDFLLILNKEKGISSIPSKRHYLDNLASYVKYYFENKNIFCSLHFVNRLDKDTSGLIIIAKHQYIHGLFAKKQIDIEKRYLTKVSSTFPYNKIEVEASIRRYLDTNKRIVSEDGDYAKTLFTLKEKNDDFCLIEALLFTGRTHQIRVHLKHLGYPILGDKIYNPDSDFDFYLKSYYLKFIHPISNEKIILEI